MALAFKNTLTWPGCCAEDTKEKRLFSAICVGNLEEVKALIRDGVNVHQTEPTGNTAVMIACSFGRLDCLLTLVLDAGANFHRSYYKGKIPLLIAIDHNHSDVAEFLIDLHAQANRDHFIYYYGPVALMKASRLGNSHIVWALLQAGICPNNVDHDGKSALFHAIQGTADPIVIRILLEAGTHVDIKDKDGNTALMVALQKGNLNGVTTFLIQMADLASQTLIGEKALMMMAKLPRTKAEVFSLSVLQAGSGDNLLVRFRHAISIFALESSQDYSTMLQIEDGACSNIRTNVDEIAHMHTVHNIRCPYEPLFMHDSENLFKYSEKNMEYVIKWIKAIIVETNNHGRTALMLATQSRCPRAVKLLLSIGANSNIRDNNGKTALMFLFDIFFHGSADNSYYDSTTADIVKCIDALVQAEADPNTTDNNGRTALMLATQSRCPRTVKLLLSIGANSNIRDNNGKTALMFLLDILFYGSADNSYYDSTTADIVECIDALVRAKADPNCTDKFEQTVLMKMAKQGSFKIVEKLLQCGANPNVKDTFGNSALAFALMNNHGPCCRILIENGAHVTCFFLKYALGQGKLELLLEHGGVAIDILDAFLHTTLYSCSHANLVKCRQLLGTILDQGTDPLLDLDHRSRISRLNQLLRGMSMQDILIDRCKQLVRLKLCNGMVDPPSTTPLGRQRYSPRPPGDFTTAQLAPHDVLRYFIANCYLTTSDLRSMRREVRRADSRRNVSSPRFLLIKKAMSQPWPLVKLAFIEVSSNLGVSPEREKRIARSGLPAKLQRVLLFQEPISRLPVCDWPNIPLCFDPIKYEEMPKPRPLLYHWPFGINMVGIFAKAARNADVDRRKAELACTLTKQLARTGSVPPDLPVELSESLKMNPTDKFKALAGADLNFGNPLFLNEEESDEEEPDKEKNY